MDKRRASSRANGSSRFGSRNNEFEIEPEIAVVAGLQPEMALARGQEIEKFGFHTSRKP